ncbi:MAG TPA: SCO family protein [Limnochorda sp.]
MVPSGVLATKTRTLLIAALLVAAALAGGAVLLDRLPGGAFFLKTSPGAAAGFAGRVIDPPLPAPDFTMTDHHLRPFTLSEHRGRLVVLFFGYTHCPDVCPTTLGQFKRVKLLLEDQAEHVQFVFITVDPEQDTPERLAVYVGPVDPDFLGLWAAPEELEPILRAYGVFVEKTPAEESPVGYWITHTSSSYVIDGKGQLRLQIPFGTAPEAVADDLRRLIAELPGGRSG